MSKKTKAELEAENQVLREVAANMTVIRDCHFEGSPTADVASAVKQIAVALEHAARALKGPESAMINIEQAAPLESPKVSGLKE